MKSLKEKWERSVQSATENGEKEVGGSCTITSIPSNSIKLLNTEQEVCYGRGGPYFIFTIFPCQLYTSLSFLLQRLCCYSLPGLSWRSRLSDLDLQYDFLFWQPIPFPHASLYSMVIFLPFHS